MRISFGGLLAPDFGMGRKTEMRAHLTATKLSDSQKTLQGQKGDLETGEGFFVSC